MTPQPIHRHSSSHFPNKNKKSSRHNISHASTDTRTQGLTGPAQVHTQVHTPAPQGLIGPSGAHTRRYRHPPPGSYRSLSGTHTQVQTPPPPGPYRSLSGTHAGTDTPPRALQVPLGHRCTSGLECTGEPRDRVIFTWACPQEGCAHTWERPDTHRHAGRCLHTHARTYAWPM